MVSLEFQKYYLNSELKMLSCDHLDFPKAPTLLTVCFKW